MALSLKYRSHLRFYVLCCSEPARNRNNDMYATVILNCIHRCIFITPTAVLINPPCHYKSMPPSAELEFSGGELMAMAAFRDTVVVGGKS